MEFIKDDETPTCGRCGGRHPFDTSVPSPLWNEVIRAQEGLSDYLCLLCIVEEFCNAGKYVTALLWGGDDGTPGITRAELTIAPLGTKHNHASCVAERENLLSRLGVAYRQIEELGGTPKWGATGD